MLEVLIETLNVVKDLRDPHITKERVIRENLDHFKSVVKSQLTLPLNLPEEVGVLNTALIDVELSISLVSVQLPILKMRLIFLFLCSVAYKSILCEV